MKKINEDNKKVVVKKKNLRKKPSLLWLKKQKINYCFNHEKINPLRKEKS